LVAAPDPVQAFAGSHYEQRQTFHLAASGNLVLVDWLCSGRAARGERWAFTQYRSRNEVFVDGERWLLDSLRLDADTGPLDGEFRLGRYNCLAMVFLVGPSVSAAATAWLREMEAAPVTRRPNFLCSASAVRQGVLVRMGGESVEAVGHEIHRRLKFLSNLLHDDPWARKW
jgi:urease accessory protein